MQQATTRRGDLDDDRELGQHGDDHGREHLDDSDSGKREHTRAAGSITVERDGSRAEAMGLAYFRLFRALRGKSVEGVAHDSLQRSWCAKIIRWNRMRRVNASFVEWLEAREEVVGNYSLRDLRARVCSNAWDVGRICYIQVREGCAVCGSSENFSEADWQREVAEQPLGEAEQAWLAKNRRVVVRVLGRRKVGDSRVLARDLVLVLAN
ncbi:hypothetical protein PF004_g23112 [Phytophthora fragariae]|uniref:Uncharacterized protein n=1 Tax=Phytophthora fragariae TaxID=53985 RepID=A0A6G0MZ94_9STRA|nr:hypothetical protein PF004_g23112 [Phytophthora fragariae]